jgi:hypothetical protein
MVCARSALGSSAGKGHSLRLVLSVTTRIHEVAIAFTTRMAYFRDCLTTGSKGEPARIILGLLPSAAIDKLPALRPAALTQLTLSDGECIRRRAQVAAGKFAG